MSVLFETSLGDIIVDLDINLCPTLSLNFLKLAKSYRYNFCAFHNVIKDFIAQTGDPTDSGLGGSSIFNLLPPSSPAYSDNKYFVPESVPKLKHTEIGTLSMAIAGEGDARGCGSQFFFTLAKDLDYLDGKHAPFGRIVEGEDTLVKINEALTDSEGKPLRDIRIRHVIVLDDPFPDPPGLLVPPASPVPTPAQLASLRVGDEEEIEEVGDPETIEAARRARDARAQALTLEMVGDLPFADVAPPENVLFVCKLNQITKSEDLELIFSRFGTILSCEIICDQKTGDSLQYAFIEFKEREGAERAYVKMDNVLVDDRRIHVDFSQSVSKLHDSWVFKKTGGRAPPNKGPTRPSGKRRDSSPPPPTPRPHGAGRHHRDLVFDLGDTDEQERSKPRQKVDDRHRGYRGGERRDYDNRAQGERGGGGGRDNRYQGGGRRSRSPPRHRNRDRDR